MRFIVAAALMLVACKPKPLAPPPEPDEALPAEAPESIADAELRRFLDGMLITSDAEPPDEATWPTNVEGSMQFHIMYVAKKKFGIETPAELAALLSRPVDELNRSDGWLLSHLHDVPRAREVWKRLLEKDPEDLGAAESLAATTELIDGPRAALAVAAKLDVSRLRSRDRRGGETPAGFELSRCRYAFRSGDYALARRFCSAAQALDEDRGGVTLAMTLLALGKHKEGLAQINQAMKSPGVARSAGAFLTLGLAQQLNGDEAGALATWNVAVARWPEYPPLVRAASGLRQSPAAWFAEEEWVADEHDATWLAYCGYVTAELGLLDHSTACYEASARLVPGPAQAHQLVFLSRTDLPEAHRQLTAAIAAAPHRELLTALAYVLYREGKYAEARTYLERVIAERWNDAKAMSLMWQVCGKQSDYLCVIEYRKRLGLPTHFSVEQYRDVEKAWKEQAEKNGVGLAVKDPASSDAPAPPPLTSLRVVTLGNRDLLELEGIDAFLNALFPGAHFTVAPREELVGVVKPGDAFALWEKVQQRLRKEPGTLYVLEHDLRFVDGKFAFSQLDLPNGRGVVSVSRLRSLTGVPMRPSAQVDSAVMTAVQARTRELIANTAGRLLGLSAPCDQPSCALREHRSVKELSVPGTLCDKHRAALAARLHGAKP